MNLWQAIRTRLFPKRRKKSDLYLENLLGYSPKDIRPYDLALTHRSSRHANNERLEFLGDSVISAVVSKQLYLLFPDADEGSLTQAKSKIVCRTHLNQVAQKIHLDVHLNYNHHQPRTAKDLYGNALEAFVGAIFIESGYKNAESFVEKYIIGKNGAYIKHLTEREVDFKSRLLEWGQLHHCEIKFEMIDDRYDRQTDTHDFVFRVIIDGREVSQAAGHTKREAQQTASRKALKGLRG